MGRHRIVLLLMLAIGIAALAPVTSKATITVGSDLSQTPTSSAGFCFLSGPSDPPCTRLTANVHAGNLHSAASPTNGHVVSWGIRTGVPPPGQTVGPSGATDTVTFRLGRPVNLPAGTFKGVATGPTVGLKANSPVMLQYPGQYSFPGPGPAIHVGDYVGIDANRTWAVSSACNNGAYFDYFSPVIANGGSPQALTGNSACELLVNVVVEPSTKVKFGGLKGPFKGIYSLVVNVPGPGRVSVSGKGVVRQAAGGVASVSKTVTNAGPTRLRIKPKGRVRRALAARGRAKVTIKVTFAPVGGSPGTTKHKLKLRAG